MMRRLAFLLVAVSALGLGACERDPGWRVGTDGVGPIGLDTPLGEAALRRLFPGAEVLAVDPGENAAGGGAFRISRGDERLLEVWLHPDGRVARVNVSSPRIPSVKGPRVGDDLGALAETGPGLVCMTGPESRWVSCSLKGLSRVFYAFDAAGLQVDEVRTVTATEMADREVRQIWFFGRVRK